jgi:hypothetical protein
MVIPAVFISILALLFTILSFWWMNWRPGNLVVGKPRSFAIARSTGRETLTLGIPLVFFNRGAMPVLVQNLRLSLLESDGGPVLFVSTRTTDELSLDAKRKLAVQFPVRAREALSLICEFDLTPADLEFEERNYSFDLEAVLGSKMVWRKLCSFDLTIVPGVRVAANQPGFRALDNFVPPTGGRIAIPSFPGSV